MIILLAMRNSLAARENTLRGPTGPPDRATRGVYVGDGKIRKSGGRRLVIELARRTYVATKHPRRPNGDRRVVVLPSRHRQPEIATSLAATPLKRRCAPPMSRFRSEPLCRPLSGRSSPAFRCNRPAPMLAGLSKLASDPARRQPAPACPHNPQSITRWSRQNAPLNQ